MAIGPGVRIGPYEVTALLGEGGMGKVWRALDTRLNRAVAIKVLREQLASTPERSARFAREARVLSQLNHPHICSLYDVGEYEAVSYLVLELLEGQTLAERIECSKPYPLPVEETLAIAVQITDGLAAAHRRGIVHRDLKPSNVFLTHGIGASVALTVKLLDFGIAKAISSPAPVSDSTPTLDTPDTLTVEGTLIGTPQYMAPEQLEGRDADVRSDLFAFGAVLYEMLTGRRAFKGETQASVIAAVLDTDPPPIASLHPVVPPACARIVKKCLAKKPDERWQTAKDLGDELKWIADGSTDQSASVGAHASPTTRPYTWLVAAALVVTALALLVRLGFISTPPDTNVYRSTIQLPSPLTGPAPGRLALSPDGRRLAFAAADENSRVVLWVRALDGLTAQPLAGTEGAQWLFWSPNSRYLAFIAGGKLKKIEANGGPTQTIADANGFGGTWNADDVILFVPVNQSVIYRVSAAGGGAPVAVTTLDEAAGETGHGVPFFLPDGRHFLYSAATNSGGRFVYVGSLDSPDDRKRLVEGGATPKYAEGFLLFLREASLIAQPFDLDRLTLRGEPIKQAEEVVIGGGPLAGGTYSVSNKGALVYQTGAPVTLASPLVWFDRNGAQISVLEQGAADADLELSPDGNHAAARVFYRNADIWIFDVVRGQRTRLTSDATNESMPVWSPDGRVAFARARGAQAGGDLYAKVASGVGADDALLQDSLEKLPTSWSTDGKFLLYTAITQSTGSFDLWVLPFTGDHKPYPLAQTKFDELSGKFSPDNRWVAFVSNETGRMEVYVTPFPGPSGKKLVSTAGGHLPRWRRDGHEIFYVAPDNSLMAAAVDREGTSMKVGDVKRLFRLRPGETADRYFYDASMDGRRFLVITRQPETVSVPPITIVVNWTAAHVK